MKKSSCKPFKVSIQRVPFCQDVYYRQSLNPAKTRTQKPSNKNNPWKNKKKTLIKTFLLNKSEQKCDVRNVNI